MSSSEEEPSNRPSGIDIVDRTVIETANELLESLEQAHRADLALHLYSAYLLKNFLSRANEKKYPFEIDQFIRTQIKDNWTSWPSVKTVIDPQTDKVYEDSIAINQLSEPGEISPNALQHSAAMLEQELDGYWQHCLATCSMRSTHMLDVDKMSMPTGLAQEVISKLDNFFEGLNNKVAKKNKIELQQGDSNQLIVSQPQHEIIKSKKSIELKYYDIITRGCEMGQDMREIYMKSLELYNDIPANFKKGQFKLPKAELKKYRLAKDGKSNISVMKKTRENYLELDKLMKDKRLTAKDKLELKRLTRKKTEFLLSKKTFFEVKGYGIENGGNYENDEIDNKYAVDDALIKIPRKN
ncbi:related to RNA polymerase I-specific transcription initiation factor RRN9 [Zygosaccharomyces bailii]|nr:related to RNA polymerase I-specific transcription initiation factor RRN9 [Zygosaccharomyces bailii ISA1307]SJM88427.1 related to RNA polymerase I-specific transcription initiation factor RRN9 [Zygosaccharomyces bailii]